MGLVHVYCGDGKGKTSAAVGLAVRAAGRGLSVAIARFLKTDDSGEVGILAKIPGITVLPSPPPYGFVSAMDEETRKNASRANRELFLRAAESAKDADVLILDEIFAAVNYGMVPEEAVLAFLKERPERTETVLTGRNPSERILAEADYVSEIVKRAHPYDRGILSRIGIEY